MHNENKMKNERCLRCIKAFAHSDILIRCPGGSGERDQLSHTLFHKALEFEG